MQAYSPAEQGGYKDGLSSYDTYHCWAATQYREKVHLGFPHFFNSPNDFSYSLMPSWQAKLGRNPNLPQVSLHWAVAQAPLPVHHQLKVSESLAPLLVQLQAAPSEVEPPHPPPSPILLRPRLSLVQIRKQPTKPTLRLWGK